MEIQEDSRLWCGVVGSALLPAFAFLPVGLRMRSVSDLKRGVYETVRQFRDSAYSDGRSLI